MPKLFYAFLTILALSLAACQSTQNNSAQSIPDTLEKSLLWELTGPGIKKPSYIFGTIHLIAEKDYFWTDKMDEHFAKTKRLVMEIDMSKMMATGMQMLQLAPMDEGKTLKDLLSEEDYELVKNYFEKETKSKEAKMVPFSMLANWKPMLLTSYVYVDMIDGDTKTYEMELMYKAQKAEMTFGGLETIQDQMDVFAKIPYEDQAEQLVEMIKETKKEQTGENEFDKMVDLYKKQDVDGLLNATTGDMDEMEGGQELLLDNRNKNWIPLILEMAKKEPVFFAVGAGHLGGKTGVIRLLMKEGYKLTPVK
ncbi:MAG: TraB/GumN family protein [Aureispira sp.]|nr:TraB/GumN family protein [Aureispira sp.]